MPAEEITAELEKAKNGDDAALAGIIAKEMPVIRAYASKAAVGLIEFDDAVQEGIIGLFGAIQGYNAAKAASFYTYASVCIRNAVYSAARNAAAKKHQPLNTSVELCDEKTVQSPEQTAIDNENYQTTVRKINTRLSGFERKVLRLYLAGCSYTETASRLACSPKAVDNALARVRSKLKK